MKHESFKETYYEDSHALLAVANLLQGKTLRQLYGADVNILFNRPSDKGQLGSVVEELHYRIQNNNRAEPDVSNLKIEIKTNPLIRKPDGTFRPKEVVSLGMIDYTALVCESFTHSKFVSKNSRILYNMYWYRENVPPQDYKFVLVDIQSIPPQDLSVIRHDWYIIRDKVAAGRAHELSKRDTKYLAAGTKGQGNQIPQPYTTQGKVHTAKRRAFVFKTKYIKHLLNNYTFDEEKQHFVKKQSKSHEISLLSTNSDGNIEKAVKAKFNDFLGQTDIDIAHNFHYEKAFIEGKDKARWHYNTSLILTGKKKRFLSRYIEEFAKSGLTVKTIRVDKNLLPLEEISFRTQCYNEEMQSKWEHSSLYEEMSAPFLWVVYQEQQGMFILKESFFWSMPESDLEHIHCKWNELKSLFQSKRYQPSYFMDSDSFYYLKIKDQKGGANKIIGQDTVTSLSHWFRRTYVQSIITERQKNS